MSTLTLTGATAGAPILSATENSNQNALTSLINGNLDATNLAAGSIGAAGHADLSSHIVDATTLALSNNQLSVPPGGIGTAQLAANAVTAAKITNATITGTQVTSNINLPGDTVQENGLNVLVSQTNASTYSLAIIRGSINRNSNGGASVLQGEGFSVSFAGPSTYTLTWSTPFTDAPVVVACPGAGEIELQGGVCVTAASTGGATMITFNAGTNSASSQVNINFFAFGQRSA